MFSKKNHGKIKNTEIMLWRLELSQYHYEIQHKPGKDHVAPDALSRVCCATEPRNKLLLLHESLGHPGYARLYNFIRYRNLPFTNEETKEVCRNCAICAEIKPRFHREKEEKLIKATRPWERLAMDCNEKGQTKQYGGRLSSLFDRQIYRNTNGKKSFLKRSTQFVLSCAERLTRPHMRLFSFPRWAMAGTGMPSWLLREGTKVLLRRFVRDKNEPLCDVVKLLMANPTYARIGAQGRKRNCRFNIISDSQPEHYSGLSR